MVKFLLLGHGRTGSTLIVKSLDEHPNVRMLGELFNIEEAERSRAFHALNRIYAPDKLEKRYYIEGEDAEEFLRNGVFYKRPWQEIQAVGYKMFYVHARRYPNEKTAWNYLIHNRDIRIIHLLRRNLFESFVSFKIAMITKEWKRWKGEAKPHSSVQPLQIDPKELEFYCNQIISYQLWARQSFRDHPFMEFEYETDICGRFESLMHDIHDFLDVPREPARQLLEKQAKRPLGEIVANYAQLKEHFRDTLYEEFFE